MIRRTAALLLALVLLAGIALAEETTSNYNGLAEYTGLVDKLYRQLQGSGLRGVLRFTLEGDAEWARPYRPLSGGLIQFRTFSDREGHTEFESYINKNGTNTANLRLWGDGENLYLNTLLLETSMIRFPWKGDFYSSLTAQGEEDPNYISAVVKALIHAADWEAVTAPLRTELEGWLMSFAGTPEQFTENGRSLISIRYTISASAVKSELKRMLRIALANEDIARQVRLYLTDEQAELGFSVDGLLYEDWAIDTLPIEDGVGIERHVTTMGEVLSTVFSFPLGPNPYGWTALEMTEADGEIRMEFRSEERPLAFSFSKSERGRGVTAWQGGIELTTEEGRHLRAAWSADRTVTTRQDDSFVSHEVTVLNFRAEPGSGSEVDFSPITGSLSVYLYSNNNDNRATVTVEIEGNADILGEHVNLTAKLVTVPPYEIREMDVSGAVDVFKIKPEERAAIPGSLVANCLAVLAYLDGGAEPEATPEPTPEPKSGEEEVEVTEIILDQDEEETPPIKGEPPADTKATPAPETTPEPDIPVLEEIIEDIDLDEEEPT